MASRKRIEFSPEGQEFFDEIITNNDFPIVILIGKEDVVKRKTKLLVKLKRSDGINIDEYLFISRMISHTKRKPRKNNIEGDIYYGYYCIPQTAFKNAVHSIVEEFGSCRIVAPYSKIDRNKNNEDDAEIYCNGRCKHAGKEKFKSKDFLIKTEEEKGIERNKMKFSEDCNCPCLGEFHGEAAGIESPYIFSDRRLKDENQSYRGYVFVEKI